MVTTTEKAAAIAERLQSETNEVLQAAEEILFHAPGPHSFSPSQMTVLRAAGLSDRETIERELGRIASVREHMADAGSASDFAAAEGRLAAAVEQDKLLRPSLEVEIANLQRKLQELETELNTAGRVVDGMRQARERLRDPRLLPKHVREELEINNRCDAVQALKAEIASLDGRLACIRGALELDPNSDGALQYAKNIDRQHAGERGYIPMVQATETGTASGTVAVTYKLIVAGLATHQRELREELPEVEFQREKALAELGRVRESLLGGRDWYVNQLAD